MWEPSMTSGRFSAMRRHQQLATGRDAAVHDPVLPVGWDLIRHRAPGISEDHPELGAEALLVELERCLALALEAEIRRHLHGTPAGQEAGSSSFERCVSTQRHRPPRLTKTE